MKRRQKPIRKGRYHRRDVKSPPEWFDSDRPEIEFPAFDGYRVGRIRTVQSLFVIIKYRSIAFIIPSTANGTWRGNCFVAPKCEKEYGIHIIQMYLAQVPEMVMTETHIIGRRVPITDPNPKYGWTRFQRYKSRYHRSLHPEKWPPEWVM